MRLKTGDRYPEFKTNDYTGREISSADFHNYPLMISFYRYAGCPFCNLRVHSLIEYYPKFVKKGLKQVAFFESPAESIKNYVGKQSPPFPVIPDPNRSIYKKFGVESSLLQFLMTPVKKPGVFVEALKKGFKPGKMEGDKTIIPADFLVNPDGRIAVAYYGKDISDHLPVSEIEGWLQSLSVN